MALPLLVLGAAVFNFIRHGPRVIIELLSDFNWIYKIICVQKKYLFYETN